MPTWKKVIVSGSQAELAAVTASIALRVGSNQQITSTQSTTFLTGSFTGSFRGDGSGLTNVPATTATSASVTAITNQTAGNPYFITFVASGSGHQPQLVNSGSAGTNSLSYNATTNIISATASLAISASNIAPAFSTGNTNNNILTANGDGTVTGEANLTFDGTTLGVSGSGGIGTNQSTFPIAPVANTINLGTTTNTAINIGTAGSTVTIPGNLTVAGSTITFNTENLTVSDKFILLASGSTSPTDGGIIVSSQANNNGNAFYYDGNENRWALAPTASSSATTVTPNSYVVSVSGSNANPTNDPLYGVLANNTKIGAMYVHTGDESIWIWS